MPIYDYQCRQGHKRELFVRRADAAPACPECGDEMVKLISVFYPRHTEKVYNLKDARIQIKGKR